MTGVRRWVVATLLLGALVLDGALWSWSFSNGGTEASLLLLYPERVVGREMLLSLVDVTEVGEDRYRVQEGAMQALVLGDPGALQVGDELYVRGVWTDVGVMRETWREVAPERGDKKLLGLLAMGVVGCLVLGGVRWDDGLVLRG